MFHLQKRNKFISVLITNEMSDDTFFFFFCNQLELWERQDLIFCLLCLKFSEDWNLAKNIPQIKILLLIVEVPA